MNKTLILLLSVLLTNCSRSTKQNEIKQPDIIMDSIPQKCVEIQLIDFESSSCQQNCDLTSRLISSEIKNDTLTAILAVHLVCSERLGGDFIIKGETLNFRTNVLPNKNGAIITMDCHCLYYLTYRFIGMNKLPNHILINGKSFSENQQDSGYIEELLPK